MPSVHGEPGSESSAILSRSIAILADTPIWPSVWDACLDLNSKRILIFHTWQHQSLTSGEGGTCHCLPFSKTTYIFPWEATAQAGAEPIITWSLFFFLRASGMGQAGTL